MSRCMYNKDKIRYMKKKIHFKIYPKIALMHMSRTLCVKVETTDRADPQHVCYGRPGGGANHSLRTAVLDYLSVLERYCFK